MILGRSMARMHNIAVPVCIVRWCSHLIFCANVAACRKLGAFPVVGV